MRHVEVVAALLVEAGRVLVQQRPPGAVRAARWEFPGGKVEPGETAEAALIRECQEELGVAVQVGELRWSNLHRYEEPPDPLEVSLRLYRCTFEGRPWGKEGQALQWARPDALTELPFVAADLPLVTLLARGEISL